MTNGDNNYTQKEMIAILLDNHKDMHNSINEIKESLTQRTTRMELTGWITCFAVLIAALSTVF